MRGIEANLPVRLGERYGEKTPLYLDRCVGYVPASGRISWQER